MRKVIQITDTKALCDDGTVWETKGDYTNDAGVYIEPYWKYLSDIPQDKEVDKADDK